RIGEGAAMIRTKGEAGSGNIVEAVSHLRQVMGELRALTLLASEELPARAKELQAPIELVRRVAETGRLPVPNFAAGGIATPPDAALCMSLGAEAVFVGSGIFKSEDPARRARAIVQATTHWQDPQEVLAACRGLGRAMEGIELATLAESERLANRGW
ncbi:MAG: pyridoxal 5'-phosphate synthase lyase subunit PdxS, partial [Deltaproteobacteria bacterium]